MEVIDKPQSSIKKNSKPIWILFGIMVFGFLLRLINLKAQPFWGDEVLSLDITTTFHKIPELINYLATVEVHPPLYYLTLHFWIAWFGAGTFAVKFLSVIFGVGCIWLSYLWGKIIFQSQRIGLWAAAITAILPFQLEFSQEARPYIIFAFFGVVASICLWQYYRTQRRAFIVYYVLANLAGMYLHYSYLFVLVPLAVWGIIEVYSMHERRSREWVIWLAANGAVLLGFSFWLTPFLYKLAFGKFPIFGYPRIGFFSRPSAFFETTLNRLVWLTTSPVIPQIQIAITFVAKVLLVGAFIWACIQLYQKQGEGRMRPLFYTAWLVVAPLVFFLFSPQSVPYTVIFERHATFVSIPLALLIIWALDALPRRALLPIGMIFILSLVPFSSDVLGNDATWDKNYDLQDAGTLINQEYHAGDIVLVALAPVRTDLTHFLHDDIPTYNFTPINYFDNNLDIYATRHTLGLIENEYQGRVQVVTPAQELMKLDEINKLYHPKRIWLYAIDGSDPAVDFWFSYHGWRHVYWSSSESQVDLYSSEK